MKIITISRTENFSASHRLYSEKLSAEENENTYGKCANLGGHGHNYTLIVTLKGIPDSKTGMVFSLSELKSIIRREIIDKVDHKNLNSDVPFLKAVIPTAENLASVFFDILDDQLPNNMLQEVRIIETTKNSAAVRRA